MAKAKRVRGFECITGFEDIQLPVRKTKLSAGYDLAIQEDFLIGAQETVILPTGLKAYMLADEYLQLHIRSSVGIKKGLRLANITGVIDADYYNNPGNEGHIMLGIRNTTQDIMHLNKGDFLAQAIFTKFLITDNDNPTSERIGGLGSTGK